MKSFYYVLAWTLLFVFVGIYINFEIEKFTDKYIYEVKIIEKHLDDDDYSTAKETLNQLLDSWHEEKVLWYDLLNHDNFDAVCLYLNILDKSILTENKSQSYEYIQKIIMSLQNISDSEKCDLNHIL